MLVELGLVNAHDKISPAGFLLPRRGRWRPRAGKRGRRRLPSPSLGAYEVSLVAESR